MHKGLWTLLPVGMMLFSSFFGAGNLIFPPALGQAAGSNLWGSLLGFLITAVGMPLLGIAAVALIGKDNQDALGERVHPLYARAVTILVALTMGPFFAVPRTGAVSFDMGLRNFLPAEYQFVGSIAYSLVFFLLTYYLSVNPQKIVAWVGKVLTPLLLLTLAILVVCALVEPMGAFQAPVGTYATAPFFKGFQDGYLTMDLLAALLFGGMVVEAIRGLKVVSEEELPKICIYAGLIAGAFLSAIYIALAYMGACSVSVLGVSPNGGIALAQMAYFYLGQYGSIVLGLVVFLACLTTSIGVTASCSSYFVKVSGDRVQYERFVLAICLFSCGVANAGLTKIIAFSIPVLCAMYPIIIALIALAFARSLFNNSKAVYRGCLFFTTLYSIFEGLSVAGVHNAALEQFFTAYLPLFTVGFGWLTPMVGGAVLGWIYAKCRN